MRDAADSLLFPFQPDSTSFRSWQPAVTVPERIGTSLRVIVPPFWKTWWFLSLLAGAAGMLIVVYKRRVEHLKKAHAAQESFSKQLLVRRSGNDNESLPSCTMASGKT
jgi:hypothetical protein